jgi:hypothetical protein
MSVGGAQKPADAVAGGERAGRDGIGTTHDDVREGGLARQGRE